MTTGTYVLPGLMLILTGVLFNNGALTANTLILAGCVVFFIASAGECGLPAGRRVFPMETRAMAIAFFHAVGTGLHHRTGPVRQINRTRPRPPRVRRLLGAGLMIAAGVVEPSAASTPSNPPSKTSPLTAKATEDTADRQDTGHQSPDEDHPIDLRGRECELVASGADRSPADGPSSVRRYH